MGALVAGVAISTFPYALDVTAKVTTLRDFFITLFFVAVGMTIPLPTASIIGLALLIVGFLLASRIVTVFFRCISCGKDCASLCPPSTYHR